MAVECCGSREDRQLARQPVEEPIKARVSRPSIAVQRIKAEPTKTDDTGAANTGVRLVVVKAVRRSSGQPGEQEEEREEPTVSEGKSNGRGGEERSSVSYRERGQPGEKKKRKDEGEEKKRRSSGRETTG
nr:uncharacterized protein LOC116427074 [Nomia melanderi]